MKVDLQPRTIARTVKIVNLKHLHTKAFFITTFILVCAALTAVNPFFIFKSALLIYHHVYKYEEMASFEEVDPYTVAAGCVWLAIKGLKFK